MSLYRGTLVDTPAPGELRIRLDHVLAVDDTGFITHIEPSSSPASVALLSSSPPPLTLSPHSFLLPTFTDLHLHAPQYLYAGTGLDLPLMQWLDTYAYAAEEKVDSDVHLAHKLYTRLVERLIEVGTTCVVAFGTIGVNANLVLARAFQEGGIRGFIGKLSMDQSPRPTYGEKSTAKSISSLTTFLDEMDALTSRLEPHAILVKPILTPRFVPVCSDELLSALGKIAKERGVKVQSHMCESRDQMGWVESTRGKRDEEVFDEAGLLTEDTVQAHVTSLPPRLMGLVKERGVTLAHCPLSNAYFSDAQFPLREAIDAGAKVGLGSDIAGGYALSLQIQMRQAVVVARLREGTRREAAAAADLDVAVDTAVGVPDNGLRVNWIESLYLATRGGKQAVGMGGALQVGMEFDAQMITLAQDGVSLGPLDLFDLPATTTEKWWTEAVERWWCNGDDRNRLGVWVQGHRLR